jgi:hypothetical protein
VFLDGSPNSVVGKGEVILNLANLSETQKNLIKVLNFVTLINISYVLADIFIVSYLTNFRCFAHSNGLSSLFYLTIISRHFLRLLCRVKVDL